MYSLTFDEDTAFVDGLPVRTMSILLTGDRGDRCHMIPAQEQLVSTITVCPLVLPTSGKNFKSVMLPQPALLALGMVAGLYISYMETLPALVVTYY